MIPGLSVSPWKQFIRSIWNDLHIHATSVKIKHVLNPVKIIFLFFNKNQMITSTILSEQIWEIIDF